MQFQTCSMEVKIETRIGFRCEALELIETTAQREKLQRVWNDKVMQHKTAVINAHERFPIKFDSMDTPRFARRNLHHVRACDM